MNAKQVLLAVCLAAVSCGEAALTVNFGSEVGKVSPKLHSAHYAPPFYRRSFINIDNDLKSLNLYASRTHDWALFNGGARIVDTHFVFPLLKRDPSDPAAYNFAATDEAIRLTRNCGMEILYRFGPSIERTGSSVAHSNIVAPKFNGSYARYADACSHIVSHYNEGWANGYEWNIPYWEIWNEPDYKNYMWTTSEDEFANLFATVLAKVKSDHPNVKVGGPAMTAWGSNKTNFFHNIIAKCKTKGVLPDFISWHYYGEGVDGLASQPEAARKWLDARGCQNTEIIIDEWHYDGNDAGGTWGLKAAIFNTAVLSRFQYTPLDLAFNYGIGYEGMWGLTDNCAGWNKTFYSLKMFGQVVAGYTRLVTVKNESGVHLLGALSEDKTKGCILVSDYTASKTTLSVTVSGVSALSNISCQVLDASNNLATKNSAVTFSGSTLTITKPKSNDYGAYLVTFAPTLK